MHITKSDFQSYDERYRARLINSLSGFKSANLVGTINPEGQTNLSIVSSVFHIGASPALIGMIVRPNTVPRHTFDNIKQTGQYTINQVSKEIWREAHQTSARYAEEMSEFTQVDLVPQYIEGISAPFVAQSRLKYAVALREITHLAINGTELVIGEITDILAEQNAIKADGFIDLESIDTVAITGLDSYHTASRLGRLSYAKPEQFAHDLCVDGTTQK